MRVYVAGKMTGLPLLNYPAFAAETARLRALGHEVVSPAELNAGMEHEGWAACMRRDLAALRTCEALQLLEGWESSRGAMRELDEARLRGIRIFYPASALMELA
jgi:hypothetical protein